MEKSNFQREVFPITQNADRTVPELVSTNLEDHAIARAFIARALDFLEKDYLPKIERCLEQLSDEQIWWRPNDEANSIGNLILHLCGNSRQWIISALGNNPDLRTRDQEFAQRQIIKRDELLVRLRGTLEEVSSVLRNLNPQQLLERRTIQRKDVDILEAVFHVTEHFSMHTGQIIMLTKFLTVKDLGFYDFSSDQPLPRWK